MPPQQHQDPEHHEPEEIERQHPRHHGRQHDLRQPRYYHKDKQLAELRARIDAKAYTHDCFLHIYESSYAYGGFITHKNISLSACADACTAHPYCNSLNFKKEGGLCAFLSTAQSVDHLVSSYCCHHVSVSCYNDTKEVTTTTGPLTSTSSPVSQTPAVDLPNVTPLPSQDNTSPSHQSYPSQGDSYPSYPSQGDAYPSYPYHLNTGPSYNTRSPDFVFPSPTPFPKQQPQPDTEPTIDGVCPFLEQMGTSREGGRIQDALTDISSADACVEYCRDMNVENGPVVCFAVDWNSESGDCFMFDTPDDTSMMNFTDRYIVHFQYNPCESIRDIQCVVHGPASFSQNTVVLGNLGANIPHAIEACDTYCYYKYSFSATTNAQGGLDNLVETLERGCGADADDYMRWRQCVSPPPTATSISTMCHCQGDVCNNVGYAALYQLYAYYPLDYDTFDLSGYNRHGYGYAKCDIKYTNLEKRSLRAAGVFDGTCAVVVKGMQLVHVSDVQDDGDLKVASAVCLWLNRMEGEEGTMTILSNGKSMEVHSDLDPNDDTSHTITVSITLGNQEYKTISPAYPTGAWQFVCMNIEDGASPSMHLYVGEDSLSGGPILVAETDLPPVPKYIDLSAYNLIIGAGQELVFPFKGILDELRFYQGELTSEDIKALMLQYNYN